LQLIGIIRIRNMKKELQSKVRLIVWTLFYFIICYVPNYIINYISCTGFVGPHHQISQPTHPPP
jgi:hypothetical protein